MKKLIYLICFLLFFISPVAIEAATYFIRDDGSANWDGTSGCGAAGNAMDITEHNGNGSFNPDDIIMICHQGGPFDGDDELIVPDSGGVGTEIIYRGEGEPGANWHWQGSIDFATGAEEAITINNKDHIIVESLKIRYMTYGIQILDNSDNITVRDNQIEYNYHGAINSLVSANNNCAAGDLDADCNDDLHIHGNTIKCCSVGDGDADIEIEGGHDVIIEKNTIYCVDTTGFPCASAAASEPYKNGVDGITLMFSDTVLIQYNKIYDHAKPAGCEGHEEAAGDDGENEIDKKWSQNVFLRYNDISGGSGNEALIIDHYCNRDPDNVELIGNWIHDAVAGSEGYATYAGQAAGTDSCDGLTFQANTFSNIPAGAITFSKTDSGTNTDILIYNNSFYKNGSGAAGAVDIYTYGITGTSADNKIINNLFQDTDNTNEYFVYHFNNETLWTFTYNRADDTDGASYVFWGTETAQLFTAKGANNEDADPGFTNEAGDDFTTTAHIAGDSTLGAAYDDGLDEDTIWANILDGSSAIVMADRDNFNAGVWGKGAFIYDSEVSASVGVTDWNVGGSGVFDWDVGGSGNIVR